jgi:dTDP-3-amino-3,4,6-trideoxy-alpha-D-glucose transaminase
VYHLFVVQSQTRDRLRDHLTRLGVETLIHYPIPIPQQPAFSSHAPAECPVAARVCGDILSLPLHPRMSDEDVAAVSSAVEEGLARCAR